MLIVWVLGSLVAWPLVGCAPTLASRPFLVAVWPAPGARLPVSVHTFELTFNRSLRADSISVTVWNEADGVPLPSEANVEVSDPRKLRVRVLQASTGEYRLRWHVMAAQGGAAADGEQRFSLRDEGSPREAPRLEVSRAAAESGDRFEVTGRGFSQGCPVQLTIGDDDQALSAVETDGSGSFITEARVPPGVPFGLQPVVAVDASGSSAATSLQVRWGGWPPLVAFTSGQPGPRPGEVTFTMSLRNRSDYLLERVSIILGQPDGGVLLRAEPNPRMDGTTVVWDLPRLDRGVTGPYRATYRATQELATHARIEFRHRRPRGCSGDDCLPAFIAETTSDAAPVAPADSVRPAL